MGLEFSDGEKPKDPVQKSFWRDNVSIKTREVEPFQKCYQAPIDPQERALDELAIANLEQNIDEVSRIVCEHGPDLLTRGMHNPRATQSILRCLNTLLTTRVPMHLMAQMEAAKNAEESERRRLAKRLDIAMRLIENLEAVAAHAPSPSTGMSLLVHERVKELKEELRCSNLPTEKSVSTTSTSPTSSDATSPAKTESSAE